LLSSQSVNKLFLLLLTNLEDAKDFIFIFIQIIKIQHCMTNKSDYNKQYYEKESPYPVRLGELKPKLQSEAFEKETSMHSLLKDIVHKHYYADEEIVNPEQISEMVRKVKEKMEIELARIRNSGAQVIEMHEKLLTHDGSDFLVFSYKERPELKPDIDSAVKLIKEKIEVRIEELKKELLARNGVDLIAFSQREIPSLKHDIDYAAQSIRRKLKAKVEKLREELQMTGS
jgi:hypothetical protein